MMNKKWYTTKSIWIEMVDYYNAGLTFKEISECIQNKFTQFGIPHGASTSLVIELYCSPDADAIFDIAFQIYLALDELLYEKNKKNS